MQPSASVDALASCVVHQEPSGSTNISSRRPSVFDVLGSSSIWSNTVKIKRSWSSSGSISSCTSDGLPASYEQETDRILRLEQELNAARNSIAEKEAKCMRLCELQNHVDSEVQELTEKLFQEAYRMVNDAETRRAKAEKLLSESRLEVDMLSAEVEALKIIVKSPASIMQITHLATATPQRISLASRFLAGTRRKERHSSVNSRKSYTLPAAGRESVTTQNEERELISEIDPIYHREFTHWREQGASLDETPFLLRIIAEDVHPCLNFNNTELREQVLNAIKANTLELESVSESKPIVRTCALSTVPRFCPYKMKVDSNAEWRYISLLARNRIAAVCDFFTYIRYVHQGIVKSGVHDSYWDIITLRKNMTLAKLGLSFVPKIGGPHAGT